MIQCISILGQHGYGGIDNELNKELKEIQNWGGVVKDVKYQVVHDGVMTYLFALIIYDDGE